MALEQHPVPQNITSFQFRLIGDMTVKQFFYLATFVVIAYFIYKSPLPFFFSVPLAIASALLGFGLAFVPIEERPMDVWVFSFVKSVYAPTLYVWQRQKDVPVATKVAPEIKKVVAAPAPTPYKAMAPPVAPPPPPALTLRPLDKPMAPPVPPPTPNLKTTTAQEVAPPVKQKETAPEIKTDVSKKSFIDLLLDLIGFPKKINLPETPSNATVVPTNLAPYRKRPMIITSQSHKKSLMSLISEFFNFAPNSTQQARSNAVKIQSANNIAQGLNTTPPVPTPLVTGEHLSLEPQNQNAKPGPAPVPPVTQNTNIKPEPPKNTANIEALEQKLNALQNELQKKVNADDRIVDLQKQLSQVLSERNKLQDEIMNLKSSASQEKVRASAPPQNSVAEVKVIQNPNIKVITADTAVKSGLPKLTIYPNIVTGIIKDDESTLLPGVLVTVRDKSGTPLRALKTNKLGQFAASTPLPDGIYIIEVEDPRSRFTFDRAQITLNGTLLPALEIIAKSQKQINRDKIAKDLFGNQNVV
jgi:hypothetical protein